MVLPGNSTLWRSRRWRSPAHGLPLLLRCWTQSLKHPAEQQTPPLGHSGELQIPSWSLCPSLSYTGSLHTPEFLQEAVPDDPGHPTLHVNCRQSFWRKLQDICRNMEDNVIIRLLNHQVIVDYKSIISLITNHDYIGLIDTWADICACVACDNNMIISRMASQMNT